MDDAPASEATASPMVPNGAACAAVVPICCIVKQPPRPFDNRRCALVSAMQPWVSTTSTSSAPAPASGSAARPVANGMYSRLLPLMMMTMVRRKLPGRCSSFIGDLIGSMHSFETFEPRWKKSRSAKN